MKKRYIVYILLLLIFMFLVLVYLLNEKFIDKYNSKKYDLNSIEVVRKLSFTSYVPYYNKGNVYYQNKDYDSAIEEYKTALKLFPPKKKECSIRINLALAMLKKLEKDEEIDKNGKKNIEDESKREEEYDRVIEKIEEIKEVLIEEGCAHKDDNNGHNEDAQRLKNELDMLEELMEAAKNGEEGEEEEQNNNNNDTDEEEPEPEIEDIDSETKKQMQLKEIQEESLKDRRRLDSYTREYEYYRGKKW